MKHDALLIVQSGLINRIDALAAQSGHIGLAHLCEEVDAIRHDAREYGLKPVECMASMLESALALGGGMGPIVQSYLAMMRDAVCCEHPDAEATTTYLAALSLRVGH